MIRDDLGVVHSLMPGCGRITLWRNGWEATMEEVDCMVCLANGGSNSVDINVVDTAISCMACITNLAAGIPYDPVARQSWRGMVHGTYSSIGSGVTRPLCRFAWIDGAWTVDAGPGKGWRIE